MKMAGAFGLLLGILAATAPSASARVIDGVVAVIDGDPVTFSEVRDAVAEGLGIPAGDADIYLREEKDVGRILRWIELLAEATLVRRDLAKAGQSVTDDEIGRAVESIRRTNNMTDAQFAEALVHEGLTLDGYRRRIRWQMERGAIVRARKLKDVTVTDEEVKAYYREHAERYREGGEVRLETLHLPSPADPAGADRGIGVRIAAQRAGEYVRAGRTLPEAAELLATVLPGVSVTVSDFVRTEDLQPEIRKELRRLRTAETSPPFFVEGSGYLIRVVERRGGTLPDLSANRDALTEELADRRSEKAFADVLAELKQAASIDIRL